MSIEMPSAGINRFSPIDDYPAGAGISVPQLDTVRQAKILEEVKRPKDAGVIRSGRNGINAGNMIAPG